MKNWNIVSFEDFMSEILKTSEETLIRDLDKDNKQKFYGNAHRICKKGKSQDFREIYHINSSSPLYSIQKNVNTNFFSNIYFPDCVYGFLKGCKYTEYLAIHKSSYKNRYFVRIDIKDFFGSIRKSDIIKCLEFYVDDNIENSLRRKIINYIVEIVTYNDKIVQGAITSPTVSNLIFRELDLRIQSYCDKVGITYSRYADDLLFSSRKNIIHKENFLKTIRKILLSKGFDINNKKTSLQKEELCLNGYVIDNSIRLSRKKLHKFLSILYYIEDKDFRGFDSSSTKYMVKNYLAGYRAFLIQIIREIPNDHYRKKLLGFIARTEVVLRKHFNED